MALEITFPRHSGINLPFYLNRILLRVTITQVN